MTISLILSIFVPLLFAAVCLPLIARFIVGNVIFHRVKKELSIGESAAGDPAAVLQEAGERKAREAFLAFLRAKTCSPFPVKTNLKEDLDTLILLFQSAFTSGENPKAKYTFSVSDLIKCSFLLMEELDGLLRNSGNFRRLGGMRISTVLRLNRISEIYNRLYEMLPFLKALRALRITGKIARALLIPLLGIPSVAISLVASFASLVITETPWRYYYAVILARVYRYGLILYGGKKSRLRSELDRFSPDRIKKDAAAVEWIINPENSGEKSDRYENAFVLYQNILKEMRVKAEKNADFSGVVYRFDRKTRFLQNLLHVPMRAASAYNPLIKPKSETKEEIIRLVKTIAGAYTDAERFYENLRILDLFDSLYMLSLLSYSRILNGTFLLENVSVDFLLTAKNVSDELFGEVLKHRIPVLERYYRSMRLYGKVRRVYKTVRSKNPVGLIWSLTGPVAAEGIKTAVRDYAYRRIGRMTLYCFESNCLGRKRLF